MLITRRKLCTHGTISTRREHYTLTRCNGEQFRTTLRTDPRFDYVSLPAPEWGRFHNIDHVDRVDKNETVTLKKHWLWNRRVRSPCLTREIAKVPFEMSPRHALHLLFAGFAGSTGSARVADLVDLVAEVSCVGFTRLLEDLAFCPTK